MMGCRVIERKKGNSMALDLQSNLSHAELLELHIILHGPMKKLLTIQDLPQNHVACLQRKL